jgi:hypothetical protein
VVTGPRLEGRVLVAGTGQCLQDYGPGKLRVCLYKPGESGKFPEHTTFVDEHGAFTFAMLEEGDWVVKIWPRGLATPDKRVTIHIASSEPVHLLDLEVRKP